MRNWTRSISCRGSVAFWFRIWMHCYKILGTAIEKRLKNAEKKENKGSKEYIAAAVAYIDEHLDNEDLSIVSVATHVYLNPVYFGRVFKNTFHMTFKQYLL